MNDATINRLCGGDFSALPQAEMDSSYFHSGIEIPLACFRMLDFSDITRRYTISLIF